VDQACQAANTNQEEDSFFHLVVICRHKVNKYFLNRASPVQVILCFYHDVNSPVQGIDRPLFLQVLCVDNNNSGMPGRGSRKSSPRVGKYQPKHIQMKTRNISIRIIGGVMLLASIVTAVTSCKKDKKETTPEVTTPVYPSTATLYGKTYPQWAAEWWKWNLQFDCAHFPLRDTTGALAGQSQSGSVFFLSGRRGHTLSVTVPAGVSILVSLVTFESDYPCASDTSFHPAAGESVEHFLTTGTQFSTDAMDQLSLTLDGDSIAHVSDYKFVSPMFNMTANADLAGCFDDCLSGSAQSFVAGGYFFMFRPLSKGTHVIHRVGGASQLFPFLYDITYNITQL
jgi:hypothetical protein